MTDRKSLPLHVVLYRQGEYWVAHCLELDLVASGHDLPAVEQDIMRICSAQVLYAYEKKKLDQLFRPPNPRVSKMVLEALESDVLDIEFKQQLIDHKELCFQMIRNAAA